MTEKARSEAGGNVTNHGVTGPGVVDPVVTGHGVSDHGVTDHGVTDHGVTDHGPRMRADARRSRAKLIEAATIAFAENGADAPLEDIARRAGVGIGTLYRHFPTRTDLQAGVFRSQVDAVCTTADELIGTVSPEQAFAGSVRAIAGYLITKRGLARALIDSLGRDSELISVCSQRMSDTVDRLLGYAQEAGVLRPDVSAKDVLRLVHGIVMACEQSPGDTDRLLDVMLDGLRARDRSARAGQREP